MELRRHIEFAILADLRRIVPTAAAAIFFQAMIE